MALSPEQIEELVSEEGFKGPMGELGWRNRAYDDPEVCALRERLEREAGITDLEVVDPVTPGFAQRAADLLERDGFVVVKDVLDEARLETIRQGCEIAIREMVGRDPNRSGNRGSHRYTQRARARALHLNLPGVTRFSTPPGWTLQVLLWLGARPLWSAGVLGRSHRSTCAV